jgi:xanthine dehydrogenase small subunit
MFVSVTHKGLVVRKKIVFYLNGIRKEIGAQEASQMLAEYLRYDQGLTGTKIMCAEGDCGACSVLKYFPHAPGTDSGNYLPINSCITLVAQLDGSSLVTVDALKNEDTLHETQKSMVQCHGSQCGFCTPGFVIALTGMVEEKLSKRENKIGPQEAKNCMTGNLCRCTGYQPIINSALSIDLAKCESVKKRYYSSGQEADLKEAFSKSVFLESEDFSFFAPKSLEEAIDYLKAQPDTRIIGSGTDLGVSHNKRKDQLTKLLSLHLLSDLYQMTEEGEDIVVGARVTHTEFRHYMKDRVPEFAKYLDIFASPQIKNVGTIIGNIANASPIGDTPPAFLALEASAIIYGPQGKRELPLSRFFLAYRKTALMPGEILGYIKFKKPGPLTTLRFYKYSNRKDLDISGINFAARIDWKDAEKKQIQKIIFAAGGVAPTPVRFLKTEEFLTQTFDKEKGLGELQAEIQPISDLRGSSAYRRVLLENFYRKFFTEVGV